MDQSSFVLKCGSKFWEQCKLVKPGPVLPGAVCDSSMLRGAEFWVSPHKLINISMTQLAVFLYKGKNTLSFLLDCVVFSLFQLLVTSIQHVICCYLAPVHLTSSSDVKCICSILCFIMSRNTGLLQKCKSDTGKK